MNRIFALAAAALLTMGVGTASADDKLKVGFIYVGPVGDFGYSYQHDQGRKALEKALGDKVETTFVENVGEGPDAERVIEKSCTQRQQADLHHLFRLHGADAESCEEISGRDVRARHRL